MTTPPHVTFVVVNWNQRQLTLDCLASLREQRYLPFNIVLVDNGSEDDSVAAVRAVFPEVIIRENGANLGVAAANNVGIQFALDNGADLIFLLNNDTVVAPDMLDHLVAVVESEATLASAGPTMLYFGAPETIWCAGNRVNRLTGKPRALYAGQTLNAVAGLKPLPVDFIASCAVLIKAQAFRDVGLMDERYFIYFDETDWFFRASTRGWRHVYVSEARMWHKVSATMGTVSPASDYYMWRNALLFVSMNFRGFFKVTAATTIIVRSLLVAAFYSLRLQGGKRLRNRDARLMALRDAFRRRWGKMGPDVAAVCYPPKP